MSRKTKRNSPLVDPSSKLSTKIRAVSGMSEGELRDWCISHAEQLDGILLSLIDLCEHYEKLGSGRLHAAQNVVQKAYPSTMEMFTTLMFAPAMDRVDYDVIRTAVQNSAKNIGGVTEGGEIEDTDEAAPAADSVVGGGQEEAASAPADEPGYGGTDGPAPAV